MCGADFFERVRLEARINETELHHAEWERLGTECIHKAREMPALCVICKRLAVLDIAGRLLLRPASVLASLLEFL